MFNLWISVVNEDIELSKEIVKNGDFIFLGKEDFRNKKVTLLTLPEHFSCADPARRRQRNRPAGRR